jgi:hypothetical protein
MFGPLVASPPRLVVGSNGFAFLGMSRGMRMAKRAAPLTVVRLRPILAA